MKKIPKTTRHTETYSFRMTKAMKQKLESTATHNTASTASVVRHAVDKLLSND